MPHVKMNFISVYSVNVHSENALLHRTMHIIQVLPDYKTKRNILSALIRQKCK